MAANSGGNSGIKSRFVTESEVEEAKLKRQQEWDEARQNGRKMPTEDPEAPIDYRSLYEKLQEQKIKKQEEHDEQFKFKNMIYKGLDQGESDFLQFAASKQAEYYAKRCDEETEELQEFRDSVSTMLSKRAAEPLVTDKPNQVNKSIDKTNPKSQKQLLSGLIRKKRSIDSNDKPTETSNTTKANIKTIDHDVEPTPAKISRTEEITPTITKEIKQNTINSLAMYSDSSDSNDSNDDTGTNT